MKQHLNTLYISTDHTHLSLDGETVSVHLKDKGCTRISLHNLQAIQTFGWDISATPQLMAHCAEIGVHLAFCSPTGKLFCNVTGFTPGNVHLRRRQYRLADDVFGSTLIAREMIAAKILNARTVLQRAVRDKKLQNDEMDAVIHTLARSVHTVRRQTSPDGLLGAEGYAAERYFSVFAQMITPAEFSFSGRVKRPPRDPVNALLSFAYSLLAADCKSALESVGLDSAVGFYHKDRPGRPGLALDLMEEFRAPLADRLVLSLLNRRQVKTSDFQMEPTGAVYMTDAARRVLLAAWQERKSEQIMHPFLQEKVTIGLLPHIQARLLAQHIRGALDSYPPMVWK
ncbi:MAG: type I-C CRISPR-associated endonuclease Cas1 [Akkermansia sp.]|nr:type I-C CRISPR-associated endonuclease Cas1 [Akkermansia sp.]